MANAETLPSLSPTAQLVTGSGVSSLLNQIRPAWRSKSLIQRVTALLPVDPSSACQRILNAAIHDLRDKIVIAGFDVAQAAASGNKLPSVSKTEDVNDLSTAHVLDLCYRMGLLSRAEWRRLKRSYEIRRDLEHEDDEYEAEIEDCVYVFKTCIDIVLSRDPIAPIRVSDIKDLIETPGAITVSPSLIEDFESAPDLRQVEIGKFLLSVSGDSKQPDIIRQNAVEALRVLSRLTRKSALAEIGSHFQEKARGRSLTLSDLKICSAAAISPYLKQSRVKEYLLTFLNNIEKIGYSWTSHSHHRALFEELEDIGGVEIFPAELRPRLISWMVKCYIGEPGGYGQGIQRPVFFSNVAAPEISRIIRSNGTLLLSDIELAANDKSIKSSLGYAPVMQRLQKLLTIAGKP